MKLDRIYKKSLIYFLVCVLLVPIFSPCSMASNALVDINADDFQKILQYYNKDTSEIKDIYRVSIDEYTIDGEIYGKEYIYRALGESNSSATYRVLFDDNLIIELKNGAVDGFSYFKSTEELTIGEKQDFSESVKWVFSIADFDSSYKVIESEAFDEDYWRISIAKMYDNIPNYYEGANLVLDRHTSEVIVFKRFDETPAEVIPSISETEAYAEIEPIVSEYGFTLADIDAELAFKRIQGVIHLIYSFTFPEYNTKLFVDAVTGELIGRSMTKDTAKAFSVSTENDVGPFYDPEGQTAAAKACFSALGYNTLVSTVAYPGANLKTGIMNYLNRSDAYGFYLACHGSPTVGLSMTPILFDQVNGSYTASDIYWQITPDEIPGNWKFVYLDSCYSAQDATWANAFNIYSSSSNRAFLGWYASVDGMASQDFSYVIFPEIINQTHSNNIRDAAVWAASQVEGGPGYTPIRFYGDRTYNGRV